MSALNHILYLLKIIWIYLIKRGLSTAGLLCQAEDLWRGHCGNINITTNHAVKMSRLISVCHLVSSTETGMRHIKSSSLIYNVKELSIQITLIYNCNFYNKMFCFSIQYVICFAYSFSKSDI